MNCGKYAQLCNKLNVLKFPTVIYHAPGVKTVWQHTYSGDFSVKSLEKWLGKVMANECRELKSMFRLRRWLAANETMAKILLLSNKDKVPPIFKALSVEFRGRASLGVSLNGSDPEIAD